MNQDELENEIKNIVSIASPSEKLLNKLKEVIKVYFITLSSYSYISIFLKY